MLRDSGIFVDVARVVVLTLGEVVVAGREADFADIDDRGSLLFAIGMTALLFEMMRPVFVLVHECGHAVAARAAGAQVLLVRIGSGRRLLTFEVGATRFDFRLVMTGGKTQHSLVSGRVQLLAIFVAGAGAEIAFVGLLGWSGLLNKLAWGDDPTTRWLLLVLVGIQALQSLLPRGSADGMLIVQLLRGQADSGSNGESGSGADWERCHGTVDGEDVEVSE